MPYGKGKKLPTAALALPAHAQSIWREAFNASFEKQGESSAFAIAWAAVKNAGYAKGEGGKWTKDADWDESKHHRAPKGGSSGGQFASGGEENLPDVHETVIQAMLERANDPNTSRVQQKLAFGDLRRHLTKSLGLKEGLRRYHELTGRGEAFGHITKAGDSWDESAHPRAPKGQAGGGQFAGGQTAGGIDQGLADSGWHPEKSTAYAGRAPDATEFGASYGDVSDEAQAFLDEHGEDFLPVVNELSHEYDASPQLVEDFMGEMGLGDDPAKVLTAFHQSYVGSFDSEEEAATDFLHESYAHLPKGLTGTVDKDSLFNSLTYDAGAPYVDVINSDDDSHWIFKRPKPLAKDSLVDDEDEETTIRVIGVNDDGAALVFDEGTNWHRSSDGYLAASPRIARTGIQVYRGWEMGVPDKETVRIHRPESEVFNLDSLRSYAHKPVTMDHPKEAVTSANWRKYAIGQTADEVLRDGGFVRIPITIMDADAIKDVEDGKRELSLGYTMELDMTPGETEDGQSYDGVQRSIRANHLAIVAAARGGKELRVGDSTGDKEMKKIVVDATTVEVDDVGGAIIPKYVERLEKGVADAATALKTAQDAAAKAASDIATLTAENATLKKKVEDARLTPQQIEQLVRDRATVVAQARAVLATVVTDGRELVDIRRQVVDAAMGAASKGWNDEQVASSFAVLAKDAKIDGTETRDGLSVVLSNPRVQHNGQQALDAAYAEHDKLLTEAWKRPVAAAS